MAFMQSVSNITLAVPAVIGIITVMGILFYHNKLKRTLQRQRKWKAVGKVKHVILYPLKSGRKMLVDSAVCTEVGLQLADSENQLRDRSYIIYREKDLSYEGSSKILLIKLTTLKNKQISLEAPEMELLLVTQPQRTTEGRTEAITFLKNEKISMLDCGDEAAKWISKYILGKGNGLRLGYNDNTYRRNLEEPYRDYLDTYPLMKGDASGLYSNISSYMLLTQESVNDVNGKVAGCNITINNFRPNIVVEDTKPFAEDNWKWVKIGNVELYMVKYCTRCPFVTFDYETSERNNNFEPLKTMKTFRQLKHLKNINLDGDKCVMGINMALEVGGVINVGDVVYASEV